MSIAYTYVYVFSMLLLIFSVKIIYPKRYNYILFNNIGNCACQKEATVTLLFQIIQYYIIVGYNNYACARGGFAESVAWVTSIILSRDHCATAGSGEKELF